MSGLQRVDGLRCEALWVDAGRGWDCGILRGWSAPGRCWWALTVLLRHGDA
jgi:hypothetical protein